MKKIIVITFCILMLCSLLLLINVGTTLASEPGYTRLDYLTVVEPTIDGVWTTDDEWTDGDVTMIGENVTFRSTWTMFSMDVVSTNFVIEILNDDTNDTGDYWQMCIDGSVDGGSAPQAGDYLIEIVGHTNLTVYEGDGTGWTEVTPESGELFFANSISASPTSSTPHWIAEFTILKTSGNIILSEIFGLRVAVYDESNSEAGVQAWPPTDQDVPDGWGINNYTMDQIPEGLSFGVLVLLSSVAVIATILVFRKRSRIDKSS